MSHIEEIENFFNDFCSQSSSEYIEFYKKMTESLSEIMLLESQISEDMLERDKAVFKSAEADLLSLLQIQVMTLTAENKASNLIIEMQDFLISRYKQVIELHESKDLFSDGSRKIQDQMIAYKSDKVDNYQKGVKLKAKTANDKWTLAKKYLLEEILKHKTLTAARKAAAKRADIVCEDRQLVKRLPDPRKKA